MARQAPIVRQEISTTLWTLTPASPEAPHHQHYYVVILHCKLAMSKPDSKRLHCSDSSLLWHCGREQMGQSGVWGGRPPVLYQIMPIYSTFEIQMQGLDLKQTALPFLTLHGCAVFLCGILHYGMALACIHQAPETLRCSSVHFMWRVKSRKLTV